VRKTTKQQAIKNAFYRLGMHATPKGVVHALAQQGIQVDEELVRLVRIEMLNRTTESRLAPSPAPSPTVRRSPKGFPRRGHRA
jgi:hypothetical protein